MFNYVTWKEGEQATQEYMKKQGYKIVYINYSCIGVELDIVAIWPKKKQVKLLKDELKSKLKNFKSRKEKQIEKQVFKNQIKNAADLLVVTEVKARSSEKFGLGSEAVSNYKQKNLARGVEYLLKNKQFKGMNVRLDVSSVDGGVVTYIENAVH